MAFLSLKLMTLPVGVDASFYTMSQSEKDAMNLERLPKDLAEAIDVFGEDSFIHKVLGSHICDKYVEAKGKEWENYRTQITQWEIDEYLYKI